MPYLAPTSHAIQISLHTLFKPWPQRHVPHMQGLENLLHLQQIERQVSQTIVVSQIEKLLASRQLRGVVDSRVVL